MDSHSNLSLTGKYNCILYAVMTPGFKMDLRPNLSEELATTLRDMIFDGDLSSGERINEVQLSARLGVSRTPLREALSMLVAEQAIDSIPRRGFFVRELSRKEFEDIYPIRSFLDPEALRLSGIPSEKSLQRLEQINKRMEAEKNMKVRVSLDDQWHLQLIENCQNQALMELIMLFMRRFRRYGLAFYREQNFVGTVNREHIEVVQALEREDMDAACEWLRRNLTSNKQPIVEWLDARNNRRL